MIFEKLISSGEKYEDLEFPPSIESLIEDINDPSADLNEEQRKNWENIKWIRPNEI